jgi:hypothetical protein
VEDSAKWAPDPVAAMKLARDSGFRSIVLSAVWEPGAAVPSVERPLRRAVAAAVHNDVAPVLAVYQLSSNTPLEPAQRAEFARFATALASDLPDVRTVIVGNEPNLNLFWLPQFGASGDDAAASAYEQLLAATYDALKADDADLTVVGGALAPRGSDDPAGSRPTHSPTEFIRDLGHAYRSSGRTTPLMDAFSIHVYGESAHIPPSLTHPNTTSLGIADYPRLVQLLGEAFDGTAQTGTTLPILYGEYGIETAIPAAKASLYKGHEVVQTVDEATQARYYVQAIATARRQKTVRGIFLFHVTDEQALTGLQTGTRYVDGSPKSSERAVRTAADG